MIRINLLPFRAARKSENIRRQVSMFLLSIVLCFLIMGYLQISLKSKINHLNTMVANTKQEIAEYKKKADEVDRIKKKLADLEKRTNVMKTLDKNRRDPVILLDAMTQLIVPNRMWLENFSSTKGSVQLSGVALDEKTTADFMKRLETSGLFAAVTLHDVKARKLGIRNMKAFSITCKMKEPEKKGK